MPLLLLPSTLCKHCEVLGLYIHRCVSETSDAVFITSAMQTSGHNICVERIKRRRAVAPKQARDAIVWLFSHNFTVSELV